MDVITPGLTDVPETMLWPLHNRAIEARRPDGIIHDPHAIAIYEQLDYNFERSFGAAEPSHAVRSVVFDQQIARFLQQHPDGLVINLGEGLETQRFRLADNQGQWFSIDLPEAMAIRERFIQADAQHQHLRYSATDTAWFDQLPANTPAIITAQGLLMYLPEQEVKQLLQHLAARFPRSQMMFDVIPHWLSARTMSAKGWMKTPHYRTPPMPWGINRNEITSVLQRWLPNLTTVDARYWPPFPRGAARWLFPLVERLPLLSNLAPALVYLEFADIESS